MPIITYKLYSSAVRSRLAIRAPYLESARETIEDLKSSDLWKYQPSVITNESGEIIEDNGL